MKHKQCFASFLFFFRCRQYTNYKSRKGSVGFHARVFPGSFIDRLYSIYKFYNYKTLNVTNVKIIKKKYHRLNCTQNEHFINYFIDNLYINV